MCSSVFIAGRNEEQERKEDLSWRPMKYVTFTVNYNDLSVSSSILGLATRKAIFRPRLGATLVRELTEKETRLQTFNIPSPPDVNQDEIPWPMGNKIDDNSFPSNINRTLLEEAINNLFIERDPSQLIGTRAVVVVYDGKLIAERYARGFSRTSKFLGWSMTKSIVSALVGILAKDEKLNIDESAPVPEWNNIGDPRHSITIKNLLQQTTGLNFVEVYDSKSDVRQMLFDTTDMAAFAASRPLKHKPGIDFYYTGGNTNILSRIIRHTVGEDEYHSFPYRKLFYKLGMYNFIMEVDASGTFVGSSYSWGTARDWARFGTLYLNRGIYNKEEILSEDWIKQTITPVNSDEGSKYGFHFWLNTSKNNDSSTQPFPDVSTDMFYASGFNGQNLFIIPSKKLVVVRLGFTKTSNKDYGANDFLKTVISSIE
ncbi:unnamed protein product [Rotaria sordida]|uniref:Beta-lactamase-related domain-containing protein n=1 Tax=Rotaria sordida TaxID=392033 RepID=A0A819S2G1_9BILA|nr:unnamed protein product [Rotaria sordida]CAF4046323.1 unnamed protein product [Rotaria sordida]